MARKKYVELPPGPTVADVAVAGYALRLDTNDPAEPARIHKLHIDGDAVALTAVAQRREPSKLARLALRLLT